MNYTKEEREEMSEEVVSTTCVLLAPARAEYLPLISDFVARCAAMGLHVRTADEPGSYIKATAF